MPPPDAERSAVFSRFIPEKPSSSHQMPCGKEYFFQKKNLFLEKIIDETGNDDIFYGINPSGEIQL